MAKDVITRFKLETTGFDSKIKQAAKNLSDYSKTATQAKEGFNQFTKSNIDAAKALGTMATSTTNVKDRAKELVGAFNDAAKAYNSLTKEQQQSDWAKALAGSLTQLQQRIKETKAEMQGLGDSTKGGIFSGLGSKMEGALAVFGGNLMTKGAGMLAGLASEMGDMVKQGVELAKQGEGIRISFERLGRGDILDGLRQATHGTVTDIELMKAAVKFNDFKLPLDELGTMLAFAQQKAKDTGQSVDYMVDSIVTGLGRKSLMILDNLGLSATEIRERMKETGDMTKAVGSIIRDQMQKAGDYVETAADRAAQANVSLQNKMEELGRKFAPVEEASNQLWTSIKIGILDIIGGPLATLLNQLTEAGRLRNQLNKMNGDPSTGQPTKVQKQLSELKGSNFKEQRYNADLERYNRQIMKADELIKKYNHNLAAQKDTWPIMKETQQIFGKMYSKNELETFQKALMSMRDEYIAGAKEIMKPVETNIDTKKSQQDVASLTRQLKELEKQRKDAVKKGDNEQVETLTKQINQVKTNLGILDPSFNKTSGTTKKEYSELEKIQAKISALTKEAYTADQDRISAIRLEIAGLQEQEKKLIAIRDLVNGKKLPDPVIPGSLKAYQDQLKESQADVVKMREEILRMKEAGEDPADIMVKQDELDDAIDNLNVIQKKIDELNGKTAKASVDLNVNTGDFNGQTYIQKLQEQLLSDAQNANMSTLGDFMNRKLREGIEGADLEGLSALLRSKIFPEDADDLDEDIETYIQTLKEKLGDKLSESDIDAIKLAIETGDFTGMSEENKNAKEGNKGFEDFTKGLNTLTAGLSSVSSGLKNIGVDVPKEVDQVIGVINGASQIISGVGTIISIFGSTAITANTTAVGLNTAAIGGLIAALKFNSATKFFGLANGGVVPAFAHGGLIGRAAAGMFVPGNSMSGDRLRLPVDGGRGVIGVNSGELILNKSSQNSLAASLMYAEALIGSIKDYSASLGNTQQTMLAQELEGNPMENTQTQPYIDGELLFLGLQAFGRRSGMGELVFSKQ